MSQHDNNSLSQVAAELARQIGRRCQQTAKQDWRWKGRCIKTVDGMTVTMPDTPANQKEYPQMKAQKKGSYDQVVAYLKPPRRPVWMSQEEFAECNDFVLVRHVRYDVKVKGIRVKRITLATTLLDPVLYTVDEFAELYVQRWQVELDIRSLKTHMQMEHLKWKSPSMVRKEIYAHIISYNLIRDLIVRAAYRFDSSPKAISHKGAIQALNAFAEKLQAETVRIDALEELC